MCELSSGEVFCFVAEANDLTAVNECPMHNKLIRLLALVPHGSSFNRLNLCGVYRKYKLHASCIIPFTKRSDVSNAPDYPIGSSVLAVYPGTTALYKAAVVGPQRKVKTH